MPTDLAVMKATWSLKPKDWDL